MGCNDLFGGKKIRISFFDVMTYMPAQPEELDLYRVTETKQGGRKIMPPYFLHNLIDF